MKFKNLAKLFWKREQKYRSKVFLRYKTRLRNPLEDITWGEAGQKIQEISHGIKALGVSRGDNVCLLAMTCHYWLLVDMGIISAGACTVPIYHSSPSDTVEYIINHCDAEIIFVRNKIQLQKVRAAWDRLPKLRYAVVMLDKGDLPEHDPRIITLEELMRLGRNDLKKDPDFLKSMRDSIELDDVASIIYTSGTTGTPKGVVLTHRNFLTSALSFYQYVPLDENSRMLSFLPLAHVFERVAGQFYGIDQGVTFTYCEKIEYLPELLVESSCTTMMVVPRILEKMHARVLQQASSMPVLKRMMFDEAISVGVQYHKRKTRNQPISKLLELRYKAAQKMVLSRIKERIAPHLKFFVVGGAPISDEIIYFFLALGFNVVEGYGLTETSAPISVNPSWANKPGTVGLPFRHFEIKIAADGEILCKGPAVFKEYFKDPEATKEAIIDGWFHTGDIGELDKDGYLKITGRKKDILITASGKNIAPARVEGMLSQSKYINQIVALGEGERYLAAIVTLNKDEVKKYLASHDIAVDNGEVLSELPEVNKLIKAEIERNSEDLASYEQIKAFHILEHELTVASGDLTPTLKVKRKVLREKHKEVIQELFRKQKSPVSS